MKSIKNQLAKLIDVKSIISFAVLVVFMILSLKEYFDPNVVTNIILIVISFYFGQQSTKNVSPTDTGGPKL